MNITWQQFWNKKHRIYVSVRHQDAYYRELIRGVLTLLPERRPITLFDFGCGDALGAFSLSKIGIQVLLHDPVPYVHERIVKRFKQETNINVLDKDEFAALSSRSVDVVLIYSVLQYISKDDFKKLLPRFHEILSSKGVLLIGDVVPSSLSMIVDLYDLLAAGLRYGFFIDAVVGVFVTLFSDYRLVRKKNGFTKYDEREIIDILTTAGFKAERHLENMGLSKHRMLIKATKIGE